MKDEFKHSFKMPFHDNLGLAVYSSGIQKCAPSHFWGPAVRDHYLIHYIVSGCGVFDDGHQKYTLRAGDGFLFIPNHIVSYIADDTDPWEYCWVGFNGTDAQRLIIQTGLSEENPVFHYENVEVLKGLLIDIYNSTGSRYCDEAYMLSGLLKFLAVLMETFGENTPLHQNGYEYVKKSIRFIEYNYSRCDMDINDIASNAGISRSHLYRLFMQHISMPPNEYLTRYRIDKAANLLKIQSSICGRGSLFCWFFRSAVFLSCF